MSRTSSLPVIDISPLRAAGVRPRSLRSRARSKPPAATPGSSTPRATAFPPDLLARLDAASRTFFALPEPEKLEIRMARGGRAWRGYFPVGGELTSGKPDMKEGVYFGTELPPDHPRVRAGLPLHGANLFPTEVPELRAAVLDYLAPQPPTAHALMEGIALSLKLDADYFHRTYTANPTILFRIFHYPAMPAVSDALGCRRAHRLRPARRCSRRTSSAACKSRPRAAGSTRRRSTARSSATSATCWTGLTGGQYRSTPHRAKNVSGRGRLSFPFFFDPDFDAEIVPLPGFALDADDRDTRWDKASVHAFSGTYGDYLLSKVSKVFPELKREVISP